MAYQNTKYVCHPVNVSIFTQTAISEMGVIFREEADLGVEYQGGKYSMLWRFTLSSKL